jgi:hypothetical protein
VGGCIINTALPCQKRLLELDMEVKDFEPENITDVEDEPPDVDTLFGFLDPKISDRDHVLPSTNVYGVSFLSSLAASIHIIYCIPLPVFLS